MPLEGLIRSEPKLLPSLATCVERPRVLRPTERTVGREAALYARARDSLRYTLVDDVDAQLGEPVDVSFARAEVASLDGVVEKAIHAVAVVLVVLGGIDSALCGNAVRAPR